MFQSYGGMDYDLYAPDSNMSHSFAKNVRGQLHNEIDNRKWKKAQTKVAVENEMYEGFKDSYIFKDDKEFLSKRRKEYFATRPGGAGYGLNYKQFKEAGAKDHLGRAASFAVAGGIVKEDTLNTLGFLSKNQKMQAQNGGKMAKAMSFAIPGATIAGMGMTYAEGGGFSDYALEMALPEIAALGGWRIGKSIGMAGARSMKPGKQNFMGKSSSIHKDVRVTKSLASGAARGIGGAMASNVGTFAAGVVGGVTGFVAAGAIGAGIGHLLNTMGDSDNLVKTLADEARHADFGSQVDYTNSNLTHRQKALSQLSKSALNNRGQLLGNEAMVLAGIM